MRLINTIAHGIIDYVISLILFASPWTFDFSQVFVAKAVILSVGFIVLMIALLTRFEMGILKFIGLKLHLFLDFFLGSFLALSPWLFNYDEIIFKPHLVFGLALVFISLLTDRILYNQLSHELR